MPLKLLIYDQREVCLLVLCLIMWLVDLDYDSRMIRVRRADECLTCPWLEVEVRKLVNEIERERNMVKSWLTNNQY